jgi:hypothetical protein
MKRAIEAALEVLYATNKYFQDAAPWALSATPELVQRRDTVLYLTLEALRVVGLVLQPVIPASAARLLDHIGVPPTHRQWTHTELPLRLTEASSSTSAVSLSPPLSSSSPSAVASITHCAATASRVAFEPLRARVCTEPRLLFPRVDEPAESSATAAAAPTSASTASAAPSAAPSSSSLSSASASAASSSTSASPARGVASLDATALGERRRLKAEQRAAQRERSLAQGRSATLTSDTKGATNAKGSSDGSVGKDAIKAL